MAVNGRVRIPLEFMYSYSWYQSYSPDHSDRTQVGRRLGNSLFPCWTTSPQRVHHLSAYYWLQNGGEPTNGTGNTARRCSSDRRDYAARGTQFCAPPHP